MSCDCTLTEEEQDKNRYKLLAGNLPLIKGTIITENGDRVDISDIFKVNTSDINPQLARAQSTYPYIRDTIVMKDGKTCSLVELLKNISEELEQAGVVFTDETRFDYVELTEADWK